MKTTNSINPLVAAEVTRRIRASIHRPPPHVGGYAGTLRRSTLHTLTLLCAAALLTHTAFAAKPPPPPPSPPPSSGTLVLDYTGQEGSGALNFGLTVAPSGSIYASGISLDSEWHGIVLASSDSGNSWSLADVFPPPGRYASWLDVAGGIASDARGNVYVAGVTVDTDFIQPDQWYVRRSTDSGATWITVDDFFPSDGSPDSFSDVTGITADASGDVYVSGLTYFSDKQAWTIRKGVGGTSFSTVDVVQNSYVAAIFAHPTAGIFAVGRTPLVVATKNKTTTSQAWLVRRSLDGGASWSNVDVFQYSSSVGSGASGIGADALGNLYVVGQGATRQGIFPNYHWLVRKSTDGGNSWSTVDDFQPSGNSPAARCVAGTPNGDVYVAGTTSDSNGTHWIVRKRALSAGVWTTIDDYQYPGADAVPQSIAANGSGNLFVGGNSGSHWLVKKY